MNISKITFENKLHRYILLLFLSLVLFLASFVAANLSAKNLLSAESAQPCDGKHIGYSVLTSSQSTISISGSYMLNSEVTAAIKITADDVTLCLNGHDINASNTTNVSALTIEGNNFTLHDCGQGVRYYTIDSTSKLLTFDNATGTDNDGSIKGGAIRGAKKSGISAERVAINLLGGNVVGNFVNGDDYGAGAYLKDCIATIKNMNFIGNSGSEGGGLYVCGSDTSVNIFSTNIKQNFAVLGGGICIVNSVSDYSKTNVAIVNSIISNNCAIGAYGGGGIFSSQSALFIENSRVTNNLAEGHGAGCYISKGATTIKDSMITENISINEACDGGGLFLSNSNIDFLGQVIVKDNYVDYINKIPNNLSIFGDVVFNKSNILSQYSYIGINFYDETKTLALSNINSENHAYIKSDNPNKMIVADSSGGLIYKDKLKLTYNANYAGGETVTELFEPNTPLTLKNNIFSREGYVFLNWSLVYSIEELGNYIEGQENVSFNEDTTLYALWHENHDGIVWEVAHTPEDISSMGGNFVISRLFYGSKEVLSGDTNLCLLSGISLNEVNVGGSANFSLYDCYINMGVLNNINVNSEQSTLNIHGGTIMNITASPAKEIYIDNGHVVKLTAMLGSFSTNTIGKIYISGSPTFGHPFLPDSYIIIPTAYNNLGKIIRGATIALNNGKSGSEKEVYEGSGFINVAIEYATGLSAPLYGQVVAEGVLDSSNDLIKLVGTGSSELNYKLSRADDKLVITKLNIDLFGDYVKFYRYNLWDAFRSPEYPCSGRPFHLYNISAPYDAKMNKIDFSGGKYVKFKLNKTYSTVSDLPNSDKARIINSLKYSAYSSESAILKAVIVTEVLYRGDGSEDRILADIGLIWSLGEHGFLYTSLDGDGAFPYSGGIGTYVTFKAHNDGDSIADGAPKDDPLSYDDFEFGSNGESIVKIPALPGNEPPVNNNIYLNFIGRVIDTNGNSLVGVNVTFTYKEINLLAVTDKSGYFIVTNFLLTIGQERAAVKLKYSSGAEQYGSKTFLNIPINSNNVVTFIYPLTNYDDDGSLQPLPHRLTIVDYLSPTCVIAGNITYYECQETTCGCDKIYGDLQGLNELSSTSVLLNKVPHIEKEMPEVIANCFKTGLTKGMKCAVCDVIIFPQAITAKINHVFDKGIVTTQPTIYNQGEKTYTCKLCGQTQVENIPKLTSKNKNEISLTWLIVLLAVLNCLELAVIIILLIKKSKKRTTKGDKLN